MLKLKKGELSTQKIIYTAFLTLSYCARFFLTFIYANIKYHFLIILAIEGDQKQVHPILPARKTSMYLEDNIAPTPPGHY